MRAADHRDVVARVDGVEARVLDGREGVDDAMTLLDRAEDTAGVPLVDESERARLEDLAAGRTERGQHWHSVLARHDELAVGYAALVLPDGDDPDGVSHGDVAIDQDHHAEGAPLRALLQACDVLGQHHDTRRLQVWMRHVTEDDLRFAAGAGYCVDRRLGVLARDLDHVEPVAPPAHMTLGPFADDDADHVVAVLAAAYEGTPDGGWTRERFGAKRRFPWFDPSDLLVARNPAGEVLGIHWTKRRGGGIGEVYNLAVHPDAQGSRLGAALLAAGLEHLRQAGCHRVILWVDLANEQGVRLYASQGFTVAWEDVALGRELVHSRDQSVAVSRFRSASGTSL